MTELAKTRQISATKRESDVRLKQTLQSLIDQQTRGIQLACLRLLHCWLVVGLVTCLPFFELPSAKEVEAT